MKGVALTRGREGNLMQDFLHWISDSHLLTAISTIFGSIVTYFIAKAKNRKDMSINDRLQLSKDQYQLIAEMRAMMQEQRDEIDSLRDEIKQLQQVNVSLIVENRELQSKIAELNARLSKLDDKSN